MNVEVADAVVVFTDDNIGVFAGVLPMNALGDENVLRLFDPLIGADGMVNDTDDAGCGGSCC
jgi:hypothetical protein